jgi:hypothetical protein
MAQSRARAHTRTPKCLDLLFLLLSALCHGNGGANRRTWTVPMQLRVGDELIDDGPRQTPMMLMVTIHHTRASDIVVPDRLSTNPFVPLAFYRNAFGL